MIFSAVIAMLSLSLMESAGLQYRMVSNMEISLKNKRKMIEKLTLFESKLGKTFLVKNAVLKNTSFENDDFDVMPIQFIPDTLHFQESEGIQYYRLTYLAITSTYTERAFRGDLPVTSTYAVREFREDLSEQAMKH